MSVAGSRSAPDMPPKNRVSPFARRGTTALPRKRSVEAGTGAAAALGGLAVLSPGTAWQQARSGPLRGALRGSRPRNWRLRARCTTRTTRCHTTPTSVQPHRQLETVSAGSVETPPHNRSHRARSCALWNWLRLRIHPATSSLPRRRPVRAEPSQYPPALNFG